MYLYLFVSLLAAKDTLNNKQIKQFIIEPTLNDIINTKCTDRINFLVNFYPAPDPSPN